MKASTLAKLSWADESQRTEALALINGTCNPEQYTRVQRWLDQCYHRPSATEVAMEALNEVLGTHGTEAVWSGDSYYKPLFVYLNTGDSYQMTLIYRYDLERYQVASVGDLIEMFERRGVKVH